METCLKIDYCEKISMVLDKDILESQAAEAIKKVCAKCEDRPCELCGGSLEALVVPSRVIGATGYDIDEHLVPCPACCPSARKIKLDDFLHPLTGGSYGGDENCDHDYPPESRDSHDEYVCWTCSKCGMRRCYDVYD